MNRFERRDDSAKVVLIVVGSIVGILLVVILACGGLTALFVYRTGQAAMPQLQAAMDLQQADGAIQDFLNKVSGGQIEAAYNGTTDGFRAKQTLPQFKTFVAQNPLLTKFIMAQQAPVNNAPGAQRLSIQYTLNDNGNGILNVTFHMVKEGEQWKIDGVTVP
jgi:hypothetical protein